MDFFGLCSVLEDVFNLISLLLLGMRVFVVVAFPPGGRYLGVEGGWGLGLV